jgi:hypothetical protein
MSGRAVSHAEDFAENIDDPLLARQAQQHPGRAPDRGFVDDQLQINRHRPRIRQFLIRRAVQAASVLLERPLHHFAPRPLHVQHVVDDDAVEPVRKRLSP